MKDYDMTYEWLDYIHTKKYENRNILKEDIIKVDNNLRREPRSGKIEGIVIHHTHTNSAKSTLSVLLQRNFSTNYEVDQQGNVYEYLNPDQFKAIATGGGANEHTVAIDVTHVGSNPFPSVQIQALKKLVSDLAKKYGFELKLAPDQGPIQWNQRKTAGENYTLFRHRNFVATGCPMNLPMEDLVSGIAQSSTGDVSGSSNNQTANSGDSGDSGDSVIVRSVLNNLKESKDKKYGNRNILKEQLNTGGAVSIVERASSVYHKGWIYKLGGLPNPSQILAGTADVASDCGGYIRWASGISNFVKVNSDEYGPKITNPEIGCAIWYDPTPGNQFGHGGIVTQAYSDGDFDTLDCGSSANDQGSIRKLIKAKQWWTNSSKGTYIFRLSKTVPPSPGNISSGSNDQNDQPADSTDSGDSVIVRSVLNNLKESKDKNIFKIKDETKDKKYSVYKKYINSLLKHLKSELKIKKPVEINFIDDKENSKKVLGKTGGYVDEEYKIYLFTDGRHIKDIMRSLSHEMIHHGQNQRGEFKKSKPASKDYAQTNPHLRKMEEEAYLKGNILFRDWEDNYKQGGN